MKTVTFVLSSITAVCACAAAAFSLVVLAQDKKKSRG